MGFLGGGGGGGGGLSEAEVQVIADAAEDAAAIYTDTLMAAYSMADPAAIPFKSGVLHPISQHTGGTTGTPPNRTVQWAAFRPAKSCTLSKLGVEQTTAGEAGSKIRLLIAEDLLGVPSDILWQSADIAGDGANGEKSADPDLAIVPSKLYYAGVQCHTAVTTRPTLRYVQSSMNGVRAYTNSFVTTGRQGFSYAMANDGNVTDPLVAATLGAGGGTFPMFWLQAD
jgi:hypothetical protein